MAEGARGGEVSKPMKQISVTQKHINEGVRQKSKYCPISLALQEAFPDECSVTVGGDDTTFVSASMGVRDIVLPDVARKFISEFDSGSKVAPFKFAIDTRRVV